MLDPYWLNTSDNVLVKRLIAKAPIHVKSDLELLITGGSETIWSLLLYTGYLTYTGYERKDEKKFYSLVILNQEILSIYRNHIAAIFSESVVGGKVAQLVTTQQSKLFAQKTSRI